jgi:hypothetical protein
MVLDTARLMAQSNGGISLQKSHSLKNILECMNQGPRNKFLTERIRGRTSRESVPLDKGRESLGVPGKLLLSKGKDLLKSTYCIPRTK